MIPEAPEGIVKNQRKVNLKGHVIGLDPQTRIRRKVVLAPENAVTAVTKAVVEAETDTAVVVGKKNPAEVLTATDIQNLERGHDPGSITNQGHVNLQPPQPVVLQRIPLDPPIHHHLMKVPLGIHSEKVNTALRFIQMFLKHGLLESQE